MVNANDLYIIGNGFDVHHSILTQYKDFRTWLASCKRLDIIEELQSVFGSRDENGFLLWSDFEKALGRYDARMAAEWGPKDLTIFEVDGEPLFIANVLESSISNIVNSSFIEWICQVQICGTPDVAFNTSACFLTFNYTDTLEKLYGISPDRILHIHGSVNDKDGIIVGHRSFRNPFDFVDSRESVRENNQRVQNVDDMNVLYKPIEKQIAKYKDFFLGLSSINRITVYGSSYDEIDWPYFDEIEENTGKRLPWLCSWHEPKDFDNAKVLMKHLNIDEDRYALFYF